ncbi:MAG TPA: hypothetical protein VIJ76_05800 [Galbitalea sp.]
MTYTVDVTREGDAWMADVIELPGAHTFARNLVALHRSVREVIGLVADLPELSGDEITYNYVDVDSELADAAKLGEQRRELEARQRGLAVEAARRIAVLTSKGYSVRDISGVLGMSPGRVSQITTVSRNNKASDRAS